MSFLDNIKSKLKKKQEKANPIEQMEDMANGLEEMVKKQLKKEELNPKTREQLEKVLTELDDYREENLIE